MLKPYSFSPLKHHSSLISTTFSFKRYLDKHNPKGRQKKVGDMSLYLQKYLFICFRRLGSVFKLINSQILQFRHSNYPYEHKRKCLIRTHLYRIFVYVPLICVLWKDVSFSHFLQNGRCVCYNEGYSVWYFITEHMWLALFKWFGKSLYKCDP